MVRDWSPPGHDARAFYADTSASAITPKHYGEEKMIGPDNNDIVRTVACLHSSGGNGRQWKALREYLGERYDVLTPNLIGYGQDRFEQGESMHIRDEVEIVAAHIRAAGGKAHLVGHSYGGAIAIHLALWHPELVASLSVYEPVMFSVLYAEDAASPEVAEVERVADSIMSQLDTIYGRWQGARDFINYWSGGDTWRHLENSQHARFAGLMPKIAAEFRALVSVGTTAQDLDVLQVPLRRVSGTSTRHSARRVVELIANHVPAIELRRFDGLGHMAPVTHAEAVNPIIVDHLGGATPEQQAQVA